MVESETQTKIRDYVYDQWDNNAQPSLMKYIEIANLSQMYDPEWNTNGLLDQAAKHIKDWILDQGVKGLKIEILREDMKAPLIFAEIDRTDSSDKSILFYGHYDKQPHFTGWKEGLAPTKPVIIDECLYGRGGADDGYAAYAAILSVKTCQHLGIPHPRILVVIEGAEESGSQNFAYYLEKLKDKVGTPSFVICTDSGTGNYEAFWYTTSLRGGIKSKLSVKVLEEGVHSGDSSGIVPSSFRIIRHLLNRIENSATGEIIKEFTVDIPAERIKEADDTVKELGAHNLSGHFPFAGKTKPITDDLLQAYLNKTWRPQLSYVGADGFPPTQIAGNVMRPFTVLGLSLRVPPSFNAAKGGQVLKEILEANPPHKAEVKLELLSASNGWEAPILKPHLSKIIHKSSELFYGKPAKALAEGGSIPLMNLLGDCFPGVQFLVTGVLGPNSNAHGPNEMLNLPFTKKLICSLTYIVANFVE